MKLYDRRIAFMISDQHLIPHGGLGSFAKSFTEMCKRLNWQVDFIMDKKPTGDLHNTIKNIGAKFVYPKDRLDYDKHRATFAFSDSYCFEQMINFRMSLVEAFNTNCYDMILCNTQESMTAVYQLNLGEYIPVVFYTHQPSAVTRERDSMDVFLQCVHDFYNKHYELPNIIVGTQSQRNKNRLLNYGAKNIEVLPMPMSERELLTPGPDKREGILYIGRWEPRKNPEDFLKVVKQTELPVRIMTNKTGQKKFKKELDKLGIKDYIIKTEIYGEEKVDFIKSCSVHFNTAHSESWSFVFFECLAQTHCVILEGQDWSDNFDSKYYHTVKLKDAAFIIKDLHSKPIPSENLEYIKNIDNTCDVAWAQFLNNFVGKQSTSNSAKINEEYTIKYSDFIVKLGRTNLAQEDIESVLGNRHKFKIVYTNTDTYFSKDDNFVPEETEFFKLEIE
jgi:glycosyltransferase involved in cell wall biosynthesis